MYASQRAPGQAKTVSVVREKIAKPVASAMSGTMDKISNALSLGSRPGAAGPQGLDNNRDAWATALQNMSGAYTPDPISAVAKVAGMGFAGYGQGKATREKEAGTTAYKKRLADTLSGTPDNTAIMGMMNDPYADGQSQQMLWDTWQRNNPTEDQLLSRRRAQLELDQADDPQYGAPVRGADGQYYYMPKTPKDGAPVPVAGFQPYEEPDKPNIVTLELGKNRKVQFDLSDPNQYARYTQMITEMQEGGAGMPAEGDLSQDIDSPMAITDNMAQDPDIKTYGVAAPILRSMYSSLSDPSSISDLDFVSGVAKILDPNSVVREAEGKMVIESQSLPAQLLGQLNKLANGESALDPNTRVAMFQLAQRRTDEARSAAEAKHGFYRQMAERNQYDPDTYVQPMPEQPRGRVGDAMSYPRMPPNLAAGGAGQALPGGAATTPAPGAGAAPRPSQTPPAAAQLPPGLWDHLQREAQGSEDPAGAMQALTELLGNPAFQQELMTSYPQFFSGPRASGSAGGAGVGGGNGW
jgi:hypothetical protein